MARGALAKDNVATKLAKAFGDDWIGEVDKKYYVWADDGGTRVQICLAMTCPKVEVDTGSAAAGYMEDDGLDFTNMTPAAQDFKPAEITKEEEQAVQDLMARLGL